jgi:hypothetical protein
MNKGIGTLVVGGLSGIAAAAANFSTAGIVAATLGGAYAGHYLDTQKYQH